MICTGCLPVGSKRTVSPPRGSDTAWESYPGLTPWAIGLCRPAGAGILRLDAGCRTTAARGSSGSVQLFQFQQVGERIRSDIEVVGIVCPRNDIPPVTIRNRHGADSFADDFPSFVELFAMLDDDLELPGVYLLQVLLGRLRGGEPAMGYGQGSSVSGFVPCECQTDALVCRVDPAAHSCVLRIRSHLVRTRVARSFVVS